MTNVPSSLLRFFAEEEYARQFIAGKMRFGILELYRVIEDARRDASEGTSSVYFKTGGPQPIHSTVVSANRYYVFCTSHPDANVPRLAEQYGRFMVRIKSPLVLLELVKASWQRNPLALDNSAFIAQVEYSKDELRDADRLLLSAPHLTYSQKHRSYEEDKEFRYLLKCKVDYKRAWENYVTLRLPDCDDICSLETI
jgi:hypothetical protein